MQIIARDYGERRSKALNSVCFRGSLPGYLDPIIIWVRRGSIVAQLTTMNLGRFESKSKSLLAEWEKHNIHLIDTTCGSYIQCGM